MNIFYFRSRLDDRRLIVESSLRVRFGEQTESSVMILFLKAGLLFLVIVESTVHSEK